MIETMPNSSTPPRTVRLADYRPPDFLIDTVDLAFDLREDGATVTSRLTVRRNPATSDPAAPLVLDGEDLKLVRVALDGEALGANRYAVDAEHADHPRPARRLHPRHRPPRSSRRHNTDAGGALHVGRQVLHPVRGRGLPPASPTSSTGPT